MAVYGEHPASIFKSLLQLPNNLGLENIANQSKTYPERAEFNLIMCGSFNELKFKK